MQELEDILFRIQHNINPPEKEIVDLDPTTLEAEQDAYEMEQRNRKRTREPMDDVKPAKKARKNGNIETSKVTAACMECGNTEVDAEATHKEANDKKDKKPKGDVRPTKKAAKIGTMEAKEPSETCNRLQPAAKKEEKRPNPDPRKSKICIECREKKVPTDTTCAMCDVAIHPNCAATHPNLILCSNCNIMILQEPEIEEELKKRSAVGNQGIAITILQEPEVKEELKKRSAVDNQGIATANLPVTITELSITIPEHGKPKQTMWDVPKWNTQGTATYKGKTVKFSITNTCR